MPYCRKTEHADPCSCLSSACSRPKLQERFWKASPYPPLALWTGTSDASASDDASAFVGGRLSNVENPAKSNVFWFHYQVTGKA